RQEPCPALRLVDPNFHEAGSGDVVILAAYLVRGAQKPRELLIIRAKLGQHVFRTDELFVVVLEALVLGYIANRAKGGPSNLTSPLRDIVCHGENLLRLLVEQKVI